MSSGTGPGGSSAAGGGAPPQQQSAAGGPDKTQAFRQVTQDESGFYDDKGMGLSNLWQVTDNLWRSKTVAEGWVFFICSFS